MSDPKKADELGDQDLEKLSGGMFPAASKGGGTRTVGPLDTCKTPSAGGPVPVPYPTTGTVGDSGTTKRKTTLGSTSGTTKAP